MADAKKIVKKKWIEIEGPAYMGNRIIGESLVTDPEKLVGRNITVNLMTLTKDSKKQNVNIKLEITKVEGGKAIADIIGFHIIPTSIRRLVRRGLKKIEQSFICTTSDNKYVLIKPLMLIRIICPGSTQTFIRKKTKEILTRLIKKMNYENLIQNLISNKIQITAKNQLKRIYPHRIFEIRYMGLLKGEVKNIEPVIEEQKEEAINETKKEEALPAAE